MKEGHKDFEFCFKKHGRLKLISPNDNLAGVYKRKSKSALNMLNSAIEKGENEWILDTSYYAKYFIVYALFMKVGIKSEIHNCTIFILRFIFNTLGIVNENICKDLEDSRDLRVDSLYYDKTFNKNKILEKANSASDFCLEVESIIESVSKEDILKIRKKFEEIKKDFSKPKYL